MNRYEYDLTHFSCVSGTIGRLQGISTIPVVAGDSFDIDITQVVRLSQLQRPLAIDAKLDSFAFFVPYRHVYGDDWESFIEGGYDESTTFTGVNLGVEVADYFAACGSGVTGTIPKWLTTGYNRIWNYWFRVPNITTSELSDTYFPTGDAGALAYGLKTARLPSYITPMDSDITTADYQITLSSSTLDLIDLEDLKGRYKTELDRAYFTRRYDELIKRNFTGRDITVEAEERPELVYHHSQWLSGYDVEGTASANHGATVGKSAGVANFNIPRRYFNEHGTLWIQSVLRYPTISEHHAHYLTTLTDPSYLEIAGDPDLISRQPPVTLQEKDFEQKSSGTDDWGLYPYAQWYRTHPSYVHRDFDVLNGFPFLGQANLASTDLDNRTYVDPDDYHNIFVDTSLGHFNIMNKLTVNAFRVVPPAVSSIYAGV